jgi:hypothetical protein
MLNPPEIYKLQALPYEREGSSKVKARRKLLLSGNPRCFYCRKLLNNNTATLEHLFSRLDIRRGLQDFSRDTVLACQKCNLKASEEQIFEIYKGFDYTFRPVFTLSIKDKSITILNNKINLKMEQVQQDQNLLPAEIQQSMNDISLQEMVSIYEIISGRSSRGIVALSKIQSIEDDATDNIANDLLAKVRATIKGGKTVDGQGNEIPVPGIQTLRMNFTGKMDKIKAFFMIPENNLIAEGERVKTLRDKYAKKKFDEQEAERARLAREQAIKDEIARIKAAIKTNIVEGIYRAVNNLNESLRTHISGIDLSNFDEKVAQINVKPQLSKSVYELFFKVPYNSNLVDDATRKAINDEVALTETYEKANEEYRAPAEGTVSMWLNSLPDKKADLERLEALKRSNPVQAANLARQLQEGEQQQNQEFQSKLEEKKSEAVQQIEVAYQDEKLSNEFEKQVAVQSAEELKNLRKTRIAIVTAPEAEVVKVFSRVLMACFMNPKFEGLFKRKKGKLAGPDEFGNPVYADWAAELLDFVAKHHEGDIEGLTWKQKISTTAKA